LVRSGITGNCLAWEFVEKRSAAPPSERGFSPGETSAASKPLKCWKPARHG
jgi:hypothetical protein